MKEEEILMKTLEVEKTGMEIIDWEEKIREYREEMEREAKLSEEKIELANK